MTAPALDYFELIKEAKRVAADRCPGKVRIAFLADCSTQYLVPLVKALFFRKGVFCEAYEAQFDAIAQEACSDDSALYRFKPEIVLIFNSTAALRRSYFAFEGAAPDFAEQSLKQIRAVWDAVKQRSSAMIFQTNFAAPYDRIFGNFELKADASFPAAVSRLNGLLAQAAKSEERVLINDIDHISSYLGRRRWFDEKLWLLSKTPCALDCLPYAAQSVVSMAQALTGPSVKCVVVDLDNTLWGGVIGDDGLEGIGLGELGDGKAYQAFQHYLLELKKRGILLAVCSRNDEGVARLPFREHPDMVLKEGDFSAFIANYENKAANIKAIQERLNIGLNAMLFIDDDYFERNLVRSTLPDVLVPEMPADPADYVKTLCELGLFEAAAFSQEDRRRADLYKDDARRENLKSSFANMDDYLKSLEMKASLGRFDSFHLPRIAQLLARSNQFNLTTRRRSLADCERFMNDQAKYRPFYITLKDKLGDNGLICAVILRRDGEDLEIDEWVMSCRVLLRGVEQFTMNAVFEIARSVGAKRVTGCYRPTPKNGLVKDIYAKFSFDRLAESSEGETRWSLDVSRYEEKPVFIAQQAEVH